MFRTEWLHSLTVCTLALSRRIYLDCVARRKAFCSWADVLNHWDTLFTIAWRLSGVVYVCAFFSRSYHVFFIFRVHLFSWFCIRIFFGSVWPFRVLAHSIEVQVQPIIARCFFWNLSCFRGEIVRSHDRKAKRTFERSSGSRGLHADRWVVRVVSSMSSKRYIT